MKKSLLKTALLSVFLVATTAFSQQTKNIKKVKLVKENPTKNVAKTKQNNEKEGLPKPYNPKEDAEAKINTLIKRAKAEKKNIIIQAGGNWCIWCLRFNHFVHTTPELKNIIDNNYLYYHLNYSPENKNEKAFAKYGDEGKKLGYPFIIVLNSDGKTIHIQESGVLEEGNGYSLKKVKTFFNAWKPTLK